MIQPMNLAFLRRLTAVGTDSGGFPMSHISITRLLGPKAASMDGSVGHIAPEVARASHFPGIYGAYPISLKLMRTMYKQSL